MVPAVVNLVATKGRDTYSGFISEFTCFKCKHFSVSLSLLIIPVENICQRQPNVNEPSACIIHMLLIVSTWLLIN